MASFPSTWAIRTAYPGILGIEEPVEPPLGCEMVTYQGQLVTYSDIFPVWYCGPFEETDDG